MNLIQHGLPYEEYAKRAGINASLLKTVDAKSLKHAKAIIDGQASEESDAKELGTSFHALLLEGRIDYVVRPETYENEKKEVKPWNWNANVCKAWEVSQGGKTILSPDDAKSVEAMVASAHDALEGMPMKGDRELSIFAEHEGLPVKARLDFLPADTEAPMVDFKSCKDANPEEFLKQALKLGYHIQSAWHMDVARWAGQPRKAFWIVGIESKKPYVSCVLKFIDQPISFLRVGRRRARAAFQKLKTAYQHNCWPGYGASAAEENAQPWMISELDATA